MSEYDGLNSLDYERHQANLRREIDRLRKESEALREAIRIKERLELEAAAEADDLRVRLGGALSIIDNLKPDADRLLWALQYPTKFCAAAMPKNYPHVSDDEQRKSIDAAKRGCG